MQKSDEVITDSSKQPVFYRVDGQVTVDTAKNEGIELHMTRLIGVKETDKGWWCIDLKDKWVLRSLIAVPVVSQLGFIQDKVETVWIPKDDSHKTAKSTAEKAVESFRKRKEMQKVIVKRQLDNASKLLEMANSLEGDELEKLLITGHLVRKVPKEWSPDVFKS